MNSYIPESWAMSDDLARRVHEQLHKKHITQEDELQNALDEIARDIAIIEPNRVDWAGWVSHLLEQMEWESNKMIG